MGIPVDRKILSTPHSPPLCVLAVMTKTLSLSEKSMQIHSLWLEVDNVDHESSCLLSIDYVPGAVLHV